MSDEDFPRIFVINLAKDKKRREDMAKRLETAKMTYEFFDAVNGYELDLKSAPYYNGKKRRRYFGRDLYAGEIGCILSHRGIFEIMDRENIPFAMVLEDDVIFEPDIREVVLALVASDIPWDVIRFLGSEKIYKRGCRLIAPLAGRYSLARLPTTPGGSHGYLLTLKAARVMLRHTKINWVPFDALQGRSWETGLETLVVHPAPLYLDLSAGTTIGDDRFDKTVQLTGLERTLFPLYRSWFKLCESFGKRYVYFSAWPRDRRHGTVRPAALEEAS